MNAELEARQWRRSIPKKSSVRLEPWNGTILRSGSSAREAQCRTQHMLVSVDSRARIRGLF